MTDRLLAKNAELGQLSSHCTLPGHLRDVLAAADAILEATADHQVRAFGLKPNPWSDRLRRVVRLAAACHDLGKANAHFQAMVKGEDVTQPIRHEWLSFWFVDQSEVRAWLSPALDDCEMLWNVMLCAIAGHHPKITHSAPTANCFMADPVTVSAGHPDFQDCLRQLSHAFELDAPPPLKELVLYKGRADRHGRRRLPDLIRQHAEYYLNTIGPERQWRRFCATAKACLVDADVAGSALWEQIDNDSERQQWITEGLHRCPSRNDLQRIVTRRLGIHQPRDFQRRISESTADVTLVEAGCGSGKTVAAYMWAGRQHPRRRLWFCYPTTGTASEGFQNYLTDDGNDRLVEGAELFHSRAAFDKLQMLSGEANEQSLDDTTVRVQSLAAWDTCIVACTVDTVLSLLQNHRRGLYAWPAIAQSVIVFDEVHCFDDQLFGNLLTFLKELPGIPVMLMTASLPSGHRQAIQDATANAGRGFQRIAGPADLEQLPRYANSSDGATVAREDALQAVREHYEDGGRGLWISNTVPRTRSVGEELQDCHAIVYHSRFRYKDRRQRHEQVTALFDSSGAGCASTSQVAEMSLDLAHATLLVTELAPIPALIQRLGRLNRRAEPSQPPADRPVRQFWVIEPIQNEEFSAAPYEEPELDAARQWLIELGSAELSQNRLVQRQTLILG